MFNDGEINGDMVNIQSDGLHTCQVFLTYSDFEVDLVLSSASCLHSSVQTFEMRQKEVVLKTTEIPIAVIPQNFGQKTTVSPTKLPPKTTVRSTKLPPTKPPTSTCVKNVRAKTGFTFKLCLDMSERVECVAPPCFVKRNITGVEIQSRGNVSIKGSNSLINLTNFQSITNLANTTKDQLVENLVLSLSVFARHEELAESVRFRRRWVQSNTFTDRLARDSRLLTTVKTSVEETLGSGEAVASRIKRQISNSHTLDMVCFLLYRAMTLLT